jgi:hypothetical protein
MVYGSLVTKSIMFMKNESDKSEDLRVFDAPHSGPLLRQAVPASAVRTNKDYFGVIARPSFFFDPPTLLAINRARRRPYSLGSHMASSITICYEVTDS